MTGPKDWAFVKIKKRPSFQQGVRDKLNTKQILTHHNSAQQQPWQQVYEFLYLQSHPAVILKCCLKSTRNMYRLKIRRETWGTNSGYADQWSSWEGIYKMLDIFDYVCFSVSVLHVVHMSSAPTVTSRCEWCFQAICKQLSELSASPSRSHCHVCSL